jgi:hypothetical protein
MRTSQNRELCSVDDVKIVDAREDSTPASSWREYLCVRRLPGGLYELSIRGFEYLGEYNDYADDEGNIPEAIDGKTVVSVEDGCICGGDLVFINEDYADVVRFRDPGAPTVVAWLKSKRWSVETALQLLMAAL